MGDRGQTDRVAIFASPNPDLDRVRAIPSEPWLWPHTMSCGPTQAKIEVKGRFKRQNGNGQTGGRTPTDRTTFSAIAVDKHVNLICRCRQQTRNGWLIAHISSACIPPIMCWCRRYSLATVYQLQFVTQHPLLQRPRANSHYCTSSNVGVNYLSLAFSNQSLNQSTWNL